MQYQLVESVPNRVRQPHGPAPVLFVVGGCSMYLGAALAVVLFDQLSPVRGGLAADARHGIGAAMKPSPACHSVPRWR
jgi:threonine/homoserine efflux transporter RhtA